MAGTALVGYALCVVLATVGVWRVARRWPRAAAPTQAHVQSLLAATRRRALIAVAVAIAVFVVLFVTGLAIPELLGLMALLAAPLGASAGLAVYAAIPPRAASVTSTARRQASLTPRTPLSYLWLPGGVALGILALLQSGFLVFTGVTSSPDDAGRYRMIAFQTADRGSSASPYAGWFYGIPLLITTALLATATVIALWRVSTTPALPEAEFADIDAGWRWATNRVIVAVGAAAVLLPFGGVALLSGISVRNAYFVDVSDAWSAAGATFEGAGLIMLVASVAALTLGALWAFALPHLATDANRTGKLEGVTQEVTL